MYDEKKKQYMKNRREKFKQAGLCARCGKNPAENGYVCCALCRKKEKAKYKRYKEIIKCYRMKENI